MNIKEWVRVMKGREFLFLFFDLLLLILPGVGLLFVYAQTTFMALDWIKLVLLGGAIMAPLDFFNVIVLSDTFVGFASKGTDDFFVLLSTSILTTGIFIYIAAFVTYIVGYTLRFFVGVVGGVEGLLLIIAFAKELWRKQRN